MESCVSCSKALEGFEAAAAGGDGVAEDRLQNTNKDDDKRQSDKEKEMQQQVKSIGLRLYGLN